MMFMVAMAAIVVPLVLLAGFRLPAKYGMTISAALVAVLALFVWQMEIGALSASALQGLHRALSILWILLGAMTLLKTLEFTGAMDRIRQGFYGISPDMRVLAVIVGLFFVSVLEGLAGFGAPVAIVAPLLVSLGLRPMAAIVIALIGDSVAVAFGAVGTPVLVGLANVPGYGDPEMFAAVSRLVTMVDFWVAIALPIIIIAVLVRVFGETKRARVRRYVYEMMPWAAAMGLVYAVSALIFAHVMGPEFISAMAGLVAMGVSILTARYGALLPGGAAWRTHTIKQKKTKSQQKLLLAWSPYIFVIAGLLVTRLVPVAQNFSMSALDISWQGILGYQQISSSWQLLYSPGSILMLGALVAVLVTRSRLAVFGRSLSVSGGILYKAAFALFPTLVMVQIFSNTHINSAELVSMPTYIAQSLASVFGGWWVGVAPTLGAMGAFIAGSSTVSTLTMAEIQHTIASLVDMPTDLVLAQQLSGAAAGNMIAVHNIVAASAVVGVYHQEGRVIRRLLPFTLAYVALSIVGAMIVLVALSFI